MLTSIINQHSDVLMRGQLYKEDPEYRKEIRALGTVPFIGHFFDDEIESRDRFDRLQNSPEQREPRNAKEVADSFFEGQSKNTAAKQVGIKFHGGTLYQNEIEKIFFSNIPYTVLLLRRENLLAAGISWYQARSINQWVSRDAENVEKPEITINIPVLKKYVHRSRDDVAEWKSILKRHEKSYLELTYEQITSQDFSYNLIWDYLGVKRIPAPAPKTHKLIKDYSHIENIEEVRQAFAGEGMGMI